MKTQANDLSPERLTQAQKWLDNPVNAIPTDIRFCLKMLLENMLKGEKSAKNAKNAAKGFHELLVKFGFKPSSEKNKSLPLSKDAPSQESVEKLAQEAKIKLDAYGSAKESLSEAMKNEIFMESAERDSAQIQILIDLSKIADEHARETARDADLEVRIASGGSADPALAPADETLFPAGPVHATASSVHFSLNKNDLEKEFGRAARGLQKETIQTKRYDFSLQMHCFDVSYETARDPISGRSVSAAPETIGLKGFQVSLRALVNLVLLTVAFLVPMHRVSRMLGNARIFHRSNLARYLGVVAQKALPVYLHMARELSNAKFLWADATPTRVNDVNAAIEKRKVWEKGERAEPCEKYPWETLVPEEPNQMQVAENKDCANEDEPQEVDSEEDSEEDATPLWRQLQDEFGYAFSEKGKKNSRSKTRHQTMVIHGRADPLDATSHTVFFRSCLGDVGNVLDKILQQRSIKKKNFIYNAIIRAPIYRATQTFSNAFH